MADMKLVKEAIQTILDFEKEKNLQGQLINPKGLETFAVFWKKFENQYKIKVYIDNAIADGIKPLREENKALQTQIGTLIDTITQDIETKAVKEVPIKPVESIQQPKKEVVPEEVVPFVPIQKIEQVKKETAEEIETKVDEIKHEWKVKESGSELEVHEYNGHTLNIIKDNNVQLFVNIDGGNNKEIKSSKDIEDAKKAIESM